MSKTTLDLSTLSDIADGAHTVKVKAKADGYIDSEFSNEVSYTKAPVIQTFTGTIKNTGTNAATYQIDNGPSVRIQTGSTVTLTAKSNQKVYMYNDGGGDFCPILTSNGVTVIANDYGGESIFSPTADNFTVEIEAH